MNQQPTDNCTSACNSDRFRIVAPVNHPDEVQVLAEAGADEIYCGVLPASWASRYGEWDCLSRRQGTIANLTSVAQLRQVAELAARFGLQASLTLNVRYTTGQISDVLDLALAWEEAGGGAVIVSSPAVLLGLQTRGSGLSRHISILANVCNSQAVAFFRRFEATRVVLPRHLTVGEMAALISKCPDFEYEAMSLNEKCRFIDGLCGFYHGTTYPDGAASVFSYERTEPGGLPVVYCHDLCYAGHGCQVPFRDKTGRPITQPVRDDVNQPACAACDLEELHRAGVRLLKIGGRGLPPELKVRAVSFLRESEKLALGGAQAGEIRQLYRVKFGQDCRGMQCYYASRWQGEE